jgi:hypothetical protein
LQGQNVDMGGSAWRHLDYIHAGDLEVRLYGGRNDQKRQ